MQLDREGTCGKILCVFLGGAPLHRFALSTKGSRGAASLSSAEPDEKHPVLFSAALPARQVGEVVSRHECQSLHTLNLSSVHSEGGDIIAAFQR